MYNYYSEELKTKTYETQLPLSSLLPIAYATIYDSYLLFILQNNNINAKRFSLYPMSVCVCVCVCTKECFRSFVQSGGIGVV